MKIDFELYRREVIVSRDPVIRLSVIDVEPEMALNTVVMIHGYGGNARQWQYQLTSLTDENRCIAIDLRGHGRSDKPLTNYTVDEMLGDISMVLEELGVHRPIIMMGHSFGGALASTFAHRNPDRVSRLVIAATAGEFSLPWYTRTLLSLPTTVLNLIRPFVRNQISAPPVVLKRYFRNALDVWSGWEMFKELDVPTLVIRGDRDLVFPEAAYEEVAQTIPYAEEVNLGVSAHMVILERHDAVERALNRFLGVKEGSWRASDSLSLRRARLLSERPWLPAYEDGVPLTIAIPRIPLSQLLKSVARRFPNRPATVFMGRKLSYRAIDRQSDRLANALRGMGIDSGDRIMILMPNLPQWVITFYGILKAGGVVVSASPVAETSEIIREVEDSGAKVLITVTTFQERVREIADRAELKHVVYTNVKDYLGWAKKIIFTLTRENKEGHRIDQYRPGERSWIDLMKGYHAEPLHIDMNPRQLALIQYTGGTTANPKGVMLSHRALVANTLQTRHWIPGIREGKEKVLAVVPFAHVYGMTTAMNVGISVGAALVIEPQFVTESILQTIKRHQPTLFPGVPTMYVAINNFPGVRKYNIRAINACISGAAPLPVEVQEAFEKLTKGRLVEGYGLSEAAPVTHANPLHGARRIGTIGVPVPNTSARIVDLRTGETLEPGQIGELVIKGPQIMDGYWNLPEATAEALQDGWLYTGDIARQDVEGYFQIISRKKDMWYPENASDGHELAFPRDVEEIIYEIPGVKEVAVVGVHNYPIAFVTTGRKLDSNTIIGYCERRLPPELVPVLVVFVEEMPKSFIGKIIRRHLLAHIPEQKRSELDILSDRIDEMLNYPFDNSQ